MAQPHGREYALDLIGRANVRRMLSGKSVEYQELLMILTQAVRSIGVFVFVSPQEQVEGLLGVNFRVRHPNLPQLVSGRTLQTLGQFA